MSQRGDGSRRNSMASTAPNRAGRIEYPECGGRISPSGSTDVSCFFLSRCASPRVTKGCDIWQVDSELALRRPRNTRSVLIRKVCCNFSSFTSHHSLNFSISVPFGPSCYPSVSKTHLQNRPFRGLEDTITLSLSTNPLWLLLYYH